MIRAALIAAALLVAIPARGQAPADQPTQEPASAVDAPPPATSPAANSTTGNLSARRPSGTAPQNTGATGSPGATQPSGTTAPPRSQAPRHDPAPAPPSNRGDDAEGDADEDEDEDEENWGVFFIELQGGYSFVNLVQFNAENFIPEAERQEGSGIVGGLALGFRIYGLTLGARATIASYFGFEIGTAGLDVAFHFPIPVVQPYIRAGFGYAWMGDADYMDPTLSNTDVFGFEIDAGAGLDIKLGRVLSIGAGADVVFLNMTRQAISDAGMAGSVELEEDGDAVGLQVRVHGHITFHI